MPEPNNLPQRKTCPFSLPPIFKQGGPALATPGPMPQKMLIGISCGGVLCNWYDHQAEDCIVWSIKALLIKIENTA